MPILKEIERIPDSYQVVHSRDNRVNLSLNRDGRVNYIYSNYNTEREVAIWLEQVSDKVLDVEYVLLVGLGLGYHLKALIEKFPHKKFFIFEPDAYLFSLSIHACDLSELLSHQNIVGLTVGTNEQIIKEFIDRLTERVSASFAQLSVPSYNRLYISEIESFNQLAIQSTKMKRSNLATFGRFAQDWINNIFKNLKYITKAPNVSFLRNKFIDVPAIVVGSGPSLQYDIKTLQGLKGRVLIIAAGTSTQALIASGIEPDIIVSIDGGKPNYNAFSKINTNDIPMLFGAFIYPDILNDSRKYITYSIMDLDVVTPHIVGHSTDVITFRSNFSVTGLCIQLAAYMGSRTIILTGQDLSFPNRKYYVDGVNHLNPNSSTIVTNSASMEVRNVFGQTNYTNHGMFVTLKDIESLIQEFPGFQFINTSQHGAIIKGAPYQSLIEIIEELKIPQKDVKIGEMVKDLFENQKKENIAPKVIRQLQSDLQELSKLKGELSRLLKLIPRIKRNLNNRNDLFLGLNKVSDIWSTISKNKTYQVYVSFGLSSVMNSYQRYISEISMQSDPKDKFKIIENHLSSLSEKILEFIPYVENTIKTSLQQLQLEQIEPKR